MELKGKVLKSTGKWYIVELINGEIIDCRVRGKIRLQEGLRATNPITVGDEVMLMPGRDEEGKAVIAEVLTRKNYIARKSTNLSKQIQLLAANIDQAYLMITLKSPETHLAFIDRFLVSAESFRVPVTILINKSDTYTEDELEYADALKFLYEGVGYPCFKICATYESDVLFLREEIKGKQVMISGHSGVGKTTLVNQLDAYLTLKTGVISTYHQQGQHTTTFAEMHALASGGYIIDTPGIRAFGLFDLDKEVISHYFPEMRLMIGACKFHNCQHINEPLCAVKNAIDEGIISTSRYQTYVQLMTEDENDVHRKKEY